MGDFRKLEVWKKAKDFAVEIYRETSQGAFCQDLRFRDQLRRAAVSIALNVAEGDELGSNRQSVRHFRIAKGSTAEVYTIVVIASEVEYLHPDTAKVWLDRCSHISSMLSKLIKARQASQTK